MWWIVDADLRAETPMPNDIGVVLAALHGTKAVDPIIGVDRSDVRVSFTMNTATSQGDAEAQAASICGLLESQVHLHLTQLSVVPES
jgi:hypothetical protein